MLRKIDEDFDTFFDAIEQSGYPAAIAQPNFVSLREHGARFSRPLDELPPNVRLLPDDFSSEAQKSILRRARIVVLPILKSSLVASGISTCLNAMLAGKCVIGTEGPGTSDIFKGEILTAPPENASALASVIRLAWENDELRRRTAEAGQRYARALGGESELYQRIIDDIDGWAQLSDGLLTSSKCAVCLFSDKPTTPYHIHAF